MTSPTTTSSPNATAIGAPAASASRATSARRGRARRKDSRAKPVTSIVLDPRSPKNARTLYAGVFDEGVFKSTDDGKTWTLKKRGLGHPDNLRVYRVILHRDGTLFAVICAKRPAAGAAADARRRRPLPFPGRGGDLGDRSTPRKPLLYPKDFSVDPRDSRRILLGARGRRPRRPVRRPLSDRGRRPDLAAHRPRRARRLSAATSIRSATAGST